MGCRWRRCNKNGMSLQLGCPNVATHRLGSIGASSSPSSGGSSRPCSRQAELATQLPGAGQSLMQQPYRGTELQGLQQPQQAPDLQHRCVGDLEVSTSTQLACANNQQQTSSAADAVLLCGVAKLAWRSHKGM